MRVLYLLNSSLPHVGASHAFMHLLPLLQARGVEPVVGLPDTQGLYQELCDRHIETIVLPSRDATWSYLRSFRDSLIFLPRTFMRRLMIRRAVRQLVAYLREHPVDLIHTNVSVYNVGVLAADILHIPHIFHLREFADRDFGVYYFPTRSLYRRRFFHGSTHHTLCITRCIQDYHSVAGDAHSRVVYDPISIPHEVHPYKAETDYFLFVGRIEPSKGIDFALAGYREYVASVAAPVPLFIAGSDNGGKFSKKIHKFVEDNHLTPHIHFLGIRSDVSSLMAGAKALIVSSEYEGFGLCMAEAQSVRCIVVARNTTGSAEQMENGRRLTGRRIALSYDTPQQLSACLLKASSTPASGLNAMRDAAFATVSALYDAQRSADDVLTFYKSILSQ